MIAMIAMEVKINLFELSIKQENQHKKRLFLKPKFLKNNF